jgi:hypothetical protein
MSQIKSSSVVLEQLIEQKIFMVRSQRIMIDRDLAELYGVSLKRLNEQVKRNQKRFPIHFMFRLSKEEAHSLRSQIATLNRGGHSKYLPYVFTEHGVTMLASVLNSDCAIQINIQIIEVFIRLRGILNEHQELRKKIASMERKYDSRFQEVFLAIRKLIEPPKLQKPKKEMGFHTRL